jgi:hypothetical protein
LAQWIGLLAWLLISSVYGKEVLQVSVSHHQGTAQAFDGIEGLEVAQWETELILPLALRPTSAGLWLQGLQFTENRLLLSGATDATRRLYRLSLPLEYHPKKLGRWQYYWHLEPAYYTDETLIDEKRFLFEYQFISRYGKRNSVNWVAGIRQDSRFGSEQLYPVFGLESRPNKKWLHHWVFPDFYSEVNFKRHHYAQLFMRPSGGYWPFTQEDGSSAAVGITNWNLGMSLRKKTKSPFYIRMEVGTKLMGSASVAGSDGDLGSAYFFMLSLETDISARN